MHRPTRARLEAPASSDRVVTFSDGVFAIAITLLVLDLHVPDAASLGPGGLPAALRAMWPNLVAFVVSFCLVGVVWANHHAMFRLIRRANHTLLVLNTLLLLCVVVLPFNAALLAEYLEAATDARRFAAQVYGGTLVLGGVLFNLVWWYAARAGLTGEHAHDPDSAAELRAVGRLWIGGPVFYFVAFVLDWVNVPLSIAVYVALIIWFAVSGPWLARRLRAIAS